MEPETVKQHDDPQEKYGVHCTVFKVLVFFNVIHVPDRELPDNKCTDTVPDKDERYRHREGESPDYPVDGEGSIDHFQVKDLAHIRHVPMEHLPLGLLGILPEPVDNKEGSRTHDRTECHQRVPPEGKPDNCRKDDGGNCKKPDPLGCDILLSPEPEIFLFKKEPVEKQEDQECSPATQEDRG